MGTQMYANRQTIGTSECPPALCWALGTHDKGRQARNNPRAPSYSWAWVETLAEE